QRDDAGAEAQRARALCRDGDEQLGRADDLPAGGMMLADPGLVKAEAIEPLHQLEIPVERRGGVLVHRMERRQEDAVSQGNVRHPGCSRVIAIGGRQRLPPPSSVSSSAIFFFTDSRRAGLSCDFIEASRTLSASSCAFFCFASRLIGRLSDNCPSKARMASSTHVGKIKLPQYEG